ncbi:hypothetical protein WDW37_12830 [Bdellovibrionota bacterium FG-1]
MCYGIGGQHEYFCKNQFRVEQERRRAEVFKREQDETAKEAREWAAKEQAFSRAFPTPEQQQEVISGLCAGMPFPLRGEAARTFGIGKWWSSLKNIGKGN